MRSGFGRIALLTVLAVTSCASSGEVNDPLEPMNRGIFWFNDKLDRYAIEPVARGYDWVMPTALERALSRFFKNLAFPVRFVNNLLQAKFKATGEETGRFVVNSTVGIAGFLDPARHWGLEPHPEDFGQTLGAWGVGPGPYLVLPVLGPSNMRDAPSLVVDGYTAITPYALTFLQLIGLYAIAALNERAQAIELVREARLAALDYYVFVRNAYSQRRRAAVEDRTGAPSDPEKQEDLYGDVTEEP